MKRRKITGLFAAIGMLLLIIDADTALAGAKEGIELCIQTVIPSLFPFFVLSVLLTNAMTGSSTAAFRPIGRLCGIPVGSEILLLTGLLGGYPVGAQAVVQAYKDRQLSKEDARRMLGFCSNAGPAFFFGIIPLQFQNKLIPLILWLIHIASALAVGALLPGRSRNTVRLRESALLGVSGAVKRSTGIMASVCAWVTLFRIVVAFLIGRLQFLPRDAGTVICGLLELANGCCQLSSIQNAAVRFVVSSGLLAFGGLCVCMQTVSATAGLGLGMYLPGKLLQTGISMLLAMLLTPPLFREFAATYVLIPLFFLITAVILGVRKKRVAFQREMVYN